MPRVKGVKNVTFKEVKLEIDPNQPEPCKHVISKRDIMYACDEYDEINRKIHDLENARSCLHNTRSAIAHAIIDKKWMEECIIKLSKPVIVEGSTSETDVQKIERLVELETAKLKLKGKEREILKCEKNVSICVSIMEHILSGCELGH